MRKTVGQEISPDALEGLTKRDWDLPLITESERQFKDDFNVFGLCDGRMAVIED